MRKLIEYGKRIKGNFNEGYDLGIGANIAIIRFFEDALINYTFIRLHRNGDKLEVITNMDNDVEFKCPFIITAPSVTSSNLEFEVKDYIINGDDIEIAYDVYEN